MGQEKVTAKTEKEFVKEVAFDCLAKMKDEEKEYIKDNPCSFDYHFGYALYIRNHYIYNMDFSDVDFEVEPDYLSVGIMSFIISELLPDEYPHGDSFADQLFCHKEFIRIRKEYKKICGHYPVELIKKYKDKVPKAESKTDGLSRSEMRELPEDHNFDAELEILRRDYDNRDKIIKELIEEVAETVWDVDALRKRAEEYGIKADELDKRINEIKNLFFDEKEYLPMPVVLMPYRDMIGEEEYFSCRELLCTELDDNPHLVEKLDKSYFHDPEVAKAVLKYTFAMGELPEYQNNEEMVRYALENNGEAIRYVNERFQKDREWVKFAIEHSEDGTIMALECMAPYRKDKELVYLACSVARWNFSYVDESFRDDDELAKMVLAQHKDSNTVYSYLSDRLKEKYGYKE